MAVSRESLLKLAAERQLQPATLERVLHLLDILGAFGTDAQIASRVALKGGTALNVFHSALDRLSVDVDLNYVGAVEKERMDDDRSALEDRIERLMMAKGYAARHQPAEHAGGKWVYRYSSVLGGFGAMEIDINYLYRAPLFGVQRMSSVTIGAHRAVEVPVLDIHEIVAGKIVALVTRQAARDLFDAHRIIRMSGLDWVKVKTATLMIGASAARFDWRKASAEAIGCDPGDINNKLTMCLHTGYFEPFGGPKAWIQAATMECRAALEPLFRFTDGEMAFLRDVIENGVIDTGPLDAPEALKRAIEASPALRWKAHNVQAWKSGRAAQRSGRNKRQKPVKKQP